MKKLLVAAVLLWTGSLHAQSEWKPLFDGKTLTNWREALYKGHAGIHVADGAIVLNAGSPMNGATFTGTFPTADYEVRFEAERLAGNDFFASLTFPVGDSFCTWVTGGWGGDIVGLSSIDGWDAADNETRASICRNEAFRATGFCLVSDQGSGAEGGVSVGGALGR